MADGFRQFIIFKVKAQAIGPGDNNDNVGDLSIPGMKVYESQDKMNADEPVDQALRKSTCRSGWAGLKVCEAHKDEYNDVPTFFYSYDTIHDPKFLMVNYRDLNATVPSDVQLGDLFMEAAAAVDVPCSKGMVPPMGGATDAAAFAQAGRRAVGITGLNHNLEDYYHTRRDTYDNMNEQGLMNCYAASVKVLEMIDNGAVQG